MTARVASPGRPFALRLLAALTRHHTVAFFRTPIAAFFTLAFPLVLLVIVAAVTGNAVVDTRSGVRVAQFITPMFAVFGVVEACFSALAIYAALQRETGVVKRMRGTPLPPWASVAARIGAAGVVSIVVMVLITGTGVAVYQVRIVWKFLPAVLVTLLVGIACFTALGLALVALVRSAATVQALTNGIIVPLAFISGIFIPASALPGWLATVGALFPLRHFADAMQQAFTPSQHGTGFAPGHLAVMAAWAAAAAFVATRVRFAEGARGPARLRVAGAHPRTAVEGGGPGGGPAGALRAAEPGRPSAWRLLRSQVGYADLALRRDPMSVFFAVVFPILLLALFPLVFGSLQVDGRRVAEFLVPAMITYGAAVTSYVNMPEAVARAREASVLKRLRGTPLPSRSYIMGRIVSALWVSAATAAGLIVIGLIAYDVRLPWQRLPAVALALVAGTACFTVLGLAVAAVVHSPQAVVAVTLGTLLPLSFISKVFLVGGDLPAVLQVIGNVFPLKHVAQAMHTAFGPGTNGFGVAWLDLAVVIAWTAAGVLAARSLSWSGTARPTALDRRSREGHATPASR